MFYVPGLFNLCVNKVAESAERFSTEIFEGLPTVILEILVSWLSVEQLLKYEQLFHQRKLSTDLAWKTCFDLRFSKTYERSSSVFRCRLVDAKTRYLNRHFQEVLNHVINERWGAAVVSESKVRIPRRKIFQSSPDPPSDVTESRRQQVYHRLQLYSGIVNHWSMYAAHCHKLLDNDLWMGLLQNVRSVRIIILKDSNLLPTLAFLHVLRCHGKLEEINVFPCRTSKRNAAKFASFCQNCDASRAFDIVGGEYERISQTRKSCEEFDTSKRTDLDCLYSFGSSDSEVSSSDSDSGAEDGWNLYDAALLPIISDTPDIVHVSDVKNQDPTDWINVSSWFEHAEEIKLYSKISFLSVHENHTPNELELRVLELIPDWTHLQGLALDFREVNNVPSLAPQLQQVVTQLTELHWLDSPCLWHLLDSEAISTARKEPFEYFNHISAPYFFGSGMVTVPDLSLSTAHLEMSCGTDLQFSQSLRPLQPLVEHDPALRTLTLRNVETTREDVSLCVTSLHARVSAGLPLDGFSVCRIFAPGPLDLLYAGDKVPARLHSLTSLRLEGCRHRSADCSLTQFIDDVVSHPNLQELWLSSNHLGDAGCQLLDRVCVAVVTGSSQIHTLDISSNHLDGDTVADIARSVARLWVTGHRSQRYRGRHLYLGDNTMTGAQQAVIVRDMGLAWDVVEAQIGSFPMSEYISQM